MTCPGSPGGLGGEGGTECRRTGTSVPGPRLTDGRGAGRQAPGGMMVSSGGQNHTHQHSTHAFLRGPSTDQPCPGVHHAAPRKLSTHSCSICLFAADEFWGRSFPVTPRQIGQVILPFTE